MPTREINSKEELRSLIGQEAAVSDWFELTQERIDFFAEATEDHQWIHIDGERARKESPYGATIAHGFLTLSMLGHFMSQAVKITFPTKMMINYGLNRARFPSAVPSGSKIRARVKLQSLEEDSGALQMNWSMTV